MTSKPADPPTRQTAQTPSSRAMKQFSQTDAEAGRGTPEIDRAPPRHKADRSRRKSEPPSQLDPGSSPYEEPNSEQRDR